MSQAIDQHQLSLMYQPQVHIDTRAIVGLEALVRWNHPQRGTIPPSEFIGAAENSGLIIVLGHEVLRMACRAARRWIDMGIEMPVMAVNVSPTQFKTTSKLTEDIANLLRDNRIRPDMLEIELTETTLMHASQHSSDVLQCLRELGVRIAIDDFGTGYSCLDYLRRFSVSRIKIAQSFVADIAGNQNSAAITRAAIGLGHELGLGVIAEGVETAEQARLLRQWGCQEAQGYYFARPLSFDDATALLSREHVSLPK
jgi:EAL domain-containing protein (putative c-di-GMP-specific phosphodiesterase class I)